MLHSISSVILQENLETYTSSVWPVTNEILVGSLYVLETKHTRTCTDNSNLIVSYNLYTNHQYIENKVDVLNWRAILIVVMLLKQVQITFCNILQTKWCSCQILFFWNWGFYCLLPWQWSTSTSSGHSLTGRNVMYHISNRSFHLEIS